MTILAAIEAPAVIVKILVHLGLPTRAPPRAPARIDEFFQTILIPREMPVQFLCQHAPLPRSPTPTPQWSAILAQTWGNGPSDPPRRGNSRISGGGIWELILPRGI